MTAAKILIVEDEGIIAKSLKVVLEEFGYEISSITASGEEAIKKVKKDKPDLVLMDIMLKGDIDGIEAAKKIKSDFNIPVIYLTAYTDKQILERAKIAEPFGYIVKPFEDSELYSTIEMALYKNQMEKRIDHLNRVLRAIRNVNQLITREKDRNILLQKACTHLIETQGYFSAWVALLDETNKLITTAEAGLGKDFLPMVSLLKHGKLPYCITKALVKTELVVIKDASSICRECPISEKYCSKGALTIRLQSNNKIYGVLSVSIDASLLPLDEELSLFTEVTEDIAFALRNIELEEGQKQAEGEIKRLASFSELSPLATVEIDKTGRINYINPAASRLLPDLSITGFAHPFLAGLESIFNTDQSMKQDILCREAQVKDIWFAQTIFSVDNGLHMRIYASEITKRKKAEQTLKESEQKYRNIFENSIEGIYQSTPEGQFISINPAMARMHGYESPEEMIMSITNIGKQLYVDPEDRKRYKNLLEEHGIVEDFESQFYRKDGTIIWVSLSARAVKDATGKVLYYEGIVEDITEHKRAEIALIESESKFKNLVEESIAGVYIIQDGVFKYVNQRCAEIHGYTIEEMVDKLGPKETILPDDLPIVEENIRKRLSGETVTVHFTFRVVRKDKKVVHIEVYGSSMMYQGKPAIIGTLIDITERKQAEEALQQSEEKHRVLIETTDTGYLILDAQGRVIDANKEYIRLTGYAALEEILGRGVVEWTAPYDLERNAAEVKRCVEQGYVRNLEIDYVNRSGQITPIELNATVMGSGDSARILSLCRDITDRRRTEQKLKESEKKYRSIFENTVEGIFQTTPEGRYLSVNPALARMAGYDSPEEMIKSITNIGNQLYVNPEDRVRYKKVLEKQGIIEGFEAQHYRKDRSIIWVSINARAVKDKAGKLLYYEGTIEDITERKRAETALKESENRYRAIFENTGTATIIVEEDTTISLANTEAERLTGYKKEEIEGKKSWTEFIVKEDLERMIASHKLRRINPDAALKNYEFKLIDRYGNQKDILLTVDMILGTKRSVASLIDITERKRAEDALKRAEEKYRNIFENAMVGIYQSTQEGRYLSVNPAMARIFGYSSPEEMIKTITDTGLQTYVNPDDRIRFRKLLESGEVVGGFEIQRYRKDKDKFWVLINSRAVFDDSGKVLYYEGIVEDVTARKKAEEALRESEIKFRSLFEESRDAIYITTKDGRFIDANQSFLDLFGETREGLMERNAKDAYTSIEDKERFKKMIKEQGAVRDYEIKLQKEDGAKIDCLLTVTPKRNDRGDIIEYQGIVRDITERKRIEDLIKHLAYHDPLTGLPNRLLFNDRLSVEIARTSRHQKRLAVMMLDLDRFKDVNDTFGHDIGDILLKAVAEGLTKLLRKSDTVARLGGDEFILILTELNQVEDASVIARNIIDSFKKPFQLNSHTISITTSIGIAVFPEDGEDPNTLVKNADAAMYRTKQAGRNNYQWYSKILKDN
jgi:diguanylate cyclase (GGDEF)-like protein/PAS domain S-box-containing protein